MYGVSLFVYNLWSNLA